MGDASKAGPVGDAGVANLPAMFGRRREKEDTLAREAAERRKLEDEQPWFLGDDDAPELDVEAGRSARMEGSDDLAP